MFDRVLTLGLLTGLAVALMGSTCIVIEEQPADVTYGEESQEGALMEEMGEESEREIER